MEDGIQTLGGCAGCGQSLSTGGDRLYAFGTAGVLCMPCALDRGGAFDEPQDRWAVPPRVDDLLGAHDAVT